MGKKYLLLLFLAFITVSSYAQKHDYKWLAGYDSNVGYSSQFNYWFGMSSFDFNQQPVAITYDSLGTNLEGSSCSMSDADGNFQFYTNGITVRKYHDEIIGDSLHNGYFLNYYPQWYYEGNPIDVVMMVLSNPMKQQIYDILYTFSDTVTVGVLRVKKLLRAQIDMSDNFGKGKVIYKDKTFSENYSSLCLSAIRHANGRDWWLLTMREGTSCYDLMLYDGSDSIRFVNQQCFNGFIYDGNAQANVLRFSSDGRYLISTHNEKGKADFFDFDRCSGTLDFIEEIDFPEKFDSTGYKILGCEYSPSGRYAYVCINKRLYQFDMLANPVSSSKTTVGVYNPHVYPAPVTYNHAQLGPDGKIYISSRNTTYYMAVINNPDLRGTTCNFQDTVRLPSFIAGLPYYPNYRLGALTGSPCDTLTGLNETARTEKEKILKVFPNPATDFVTIDYGFTDWSKGEVSLEISNELGQVVHEQKLPMYSGFQKIDVSQSASGFYTTYIKRNGQIIATAKFAKQ